MQSNNNDKAAIIRTIAREWGALALLAVVILGGGYYMLVNHSADTLSLRAAIEKNIAAISDLTKIIELLRSDMQNQASTHPVKITPPATIRP